MSLRIKPNWMVKFAYVMLALNTAGVAVNYYHHERPRLLMSLICACLWTINILIWSRIPEPKE